MTLSTAIAIPRPAERHLYVVDLDYALYHHGGVLSQATLWACPGEGASWLWNLRRFRPVVREGNAAAHTGTGDDAAPEAVEYGFRRLLMPAASLFFSDAAWTAAEAIGDPGMPAGSSQGVHIGLSLMALAGGEEYAARLPVAREPVLIGAEFAMGIARPEGGLYLLHRREDITWHSGALEDRPGEPFWTLNGRRGSDCSRHMFVNKDNPVSARHRGLWRAYSLRLQDWLEQVEALEDFWRN
jgi:hypothetical protein